MQRFLDPAVLAGISGLDLVAKTVVDGFVSGLHRSPDFGFSQEFAEYRAYTPGDDLRHVDWNVFARTEKAFLKRYRGETNTLMTVLLDASSSMKYTSHSITKMDYARYLAGSLFYLANQMQRDAAGLIVFDDEVRSYIRPSMRQGQLHRLLTSLEHAEPRARTDFAKPLHHFQNFLRKRGLVIMISDFYESPELIVRTVSPLRYHGSEVVLFHILDPKEIKPNLGEPSILVDMETDEHMEVTPEYSQNEYRQKMDAHLTDLRDRARAAGLDYYLAVTDKPLDAALREYLTIRQGEKLMGFLAPWFLAGAVAAGLPIYLHLLQRHTATPRSFSSLMFFEKRTQSSIKHRRLRYLLLFSLRLALLLLLALAFANPFINRSAASVSGDRLLVVAIDDSFSMRAGTRLADARREALAVLDARRPAQPAQVVALDSQPRLLTQVTQDPAQLRAAVESIQPTDSHASFSELSRLLRSMSDTLHTPIEVHLISDMQKTAMPASFAEMAIPAGVTLVPHPVATQAVPNWTVESVNAPGEIADPKKAQVQAVVAGFHTTAATRMVSLVVNGKTVATQSVAVPANGRATVQFQSLDVPYGLTRCEVKIDSADVFPADDAMLFAVERSDPQRVLFVHEPGDTRSPLYFNSALAAAAETAFQLDSIDVDRVANADPTKYAFVVVSDVFSLPASFESALGKYVGGGGSVLIAAGTSASRRQRIPVTGDSILESHNYSRDPARFLTVGETDPSYPSLEKADRWAGVRFYFAVRVNPDNYRVAARLTDQTPLLLEKRIGEGRVLLLTTGLDNLTNDFPLHPVFVPFVEQTARYLSGIQRRSGSSVVDSFMELRTAKEQAVSVEVIDPAGKRPLTLKDATTAQSFQLTQAGFYELHLANGRHDLIGVNADRRESDLDVIPADTMALWRGNSASDTQQAAAGGTTQENTRAFGLWWYLILGLLAVTLAESLVASRYLGTSREEL